VNVTWAPRGRVHDAGAAFTDFPGDGLADLVAVGQHSAVFYAVQDEGGVFVAPGCRGLPDEYAGVSGPAEVILARRTTVPCDPASLPDLWEDWRVPRLP
jgi:hypothetical protein